ncbi:Brl1p SCDLUD_004599 [Saccharomycodes ludwigii]|uniref:Brl1p n=1 Tax=Saccharomycodes ludwigii TaxID=36035 RepID=UPI001E85782E|nr:hypothetical protein SCDLUD_004599 [Saccharomycodes ludwigii]KAH3899170.1 hypothetical protein SCDLUD_004599 [Saccharomycodes ludwigii]
MDDFMNLSLDTDPREYFKECDRINTQLSGFTLPKETDERYGELQDNAMIDSDCYYNYSTRTISQLEYKIDYCNRNSMNNNKKYETFGMHMIKKYLFNKKNSKKGALIFGINLEQENKGVSTTNNNNNNIIINNNINNEANELPGLCLKEEEEEEEEKKDGQEHQLQKEDVTIPKPKPSNKYLQCDGGKTDEDLELLKLDDKEEICGDTYEGKNISHESTKSTKEVGNFLKALVSPTTLGVATARKQLIEEGSDVNLEARQKEEEMKREPSKKLDFNVAIKNYNENNDQNDNNICGVKSISNCFAEQQDSKKACNFSVNNHYYNFFCNGPMPYTQNFPFYSQLIPVSNNDPGSNNNNNNNGNSNDAPTSGSEYHDNSYNYNSHLPQPWSYKSHPQHKFMYIFTSYLQFGLNILTYMSVISILLTVFKSIKSDINNTWNQEILKFNYESMKCELQYIRNKCQDNTAPALQNLCYDWYECMKRDNNIMFKERTQHIAALFGKIFNAIIGELEWKSVLIVIALLYFWIFGTNFFLGFIRAKSYYDNGKGRDDVFYENSTNTKPNNDKNENGDIKNNSTTKLLKN